MTPSSKHRLARLAKRNKHGYSPEGLMALGKKYRDGDRGNPNGTKTLDARLRKRQGSIVDFDALEIEHVAPLVIIRKVL